MALTFETPAPRDRLPAESHAEPLRAVERALAGLRFGTIQLVLHEGRVVQIDVTERQRFA